MSISFSEISLVVLVALLVIKPENLPGTAQTLGKWLRLIREGSARLKQEIEEPLAKLAEKTQEVKKEPADSKGLVD